VRNFSSTASTGELESVIINDQSTNK
jgi:hypothetical protein